MKILFFAAFMAIAALTHGQQVNVFGEYSSGGAPVETMEAEAIFLFNGNWDNVKGAPTAAAHNTASYTGTAVEGSAGLNANCNNCAAAISIHEYGNYFTVFGNSLKWGLSAEIALFAGMISNDGFELTCQTGTPALVFRTGNGTSVTVATSSNISITSGQYFSWAVVVDKIAGTVDFYVDGAFVSSGVARTDFKTNTTARVGVTMHDSYASWCEHDAVHIYPAKLTALELADLDAAPATEITR